MKAATRESRGKSSTRKTATRARDQRTTGQGSGGYPPNANADDRKFLDRAGKGLSKSTLRAKWLHDPSEKPDRNGQTLATRNVEVIRAWAEERGGTPATVGNAEGEARVLRIMFDGGEAGRENSGLRPISWDEWLGVFERRKLVFLFQQKRRDGSQSNFFRLDSPDREEG